MRGPGRTPATGALPALTGGSREGRSQYLAFTLSGIPLALGIGEVREIVEDHPVLPVPGIPAVVPGVIHLRGAVLPLVDLGALLSLPAAPPGRRSCVVIVEVPVEGKSQRMGLRVEAATGVLDLDSGDVQKVPAFGMRIRTDHLRGIARTEDGMVLILDLERVLGSPADSAEAPAADGAEAPENAGEGRKATGGAPGTDCSGDRATGRGSGRTQGGGAC